ncbi:MAG: zf-TFIIB domain-containing protein [Pseudomonadales bacterium]|nr:zf-TFIIB domain-containing protein [Halioglobus sp.]MCP5122923.1 zf-TFIIB domain-containing protein [Pseudomonadales bacterium]MCP5193830.1 zf-TFIIB domain-containing protein [Pseudomonadales bacterium]
MECPKCAGDMKPIEYGTDIRVRRCSGCGGIYCDRQVLELMRAEWQVDAVLDTGSAVQGARNNEIRDIACPGCAATMRRIADEEQSHVTLDVCPACDGVFLDAGELSDLKSVTLMDHLRRLLAIFEK